MKLHRVALPVLALGLLLGVSGGIGWVSGSREDTAVGPVTSVPGADVPAPQLLGTADLDEAVVRMQQRLRARPADAPTWASLALAYVEQARRSGDASYYPKAARAAARSLREEPEDNAPALAAQASVAAARHDFRGALALSRRALAIDPYQPGALAIRVDALTELGRYRAQLRALDVADRRHPGTPVFARYSYAYELRGRVDQAAALLRRALGSTRDAGDRAFLLTQLAELERRQDRLSASARHLREALAADPRWALALASRARLAVARGELRDALGRWRQVARLMPLPEYVSELGELYDVLGMPRRAREQYAVVAATARLLASYGVRTDLEVALFQADHGDPRAALRAGRAAWRQRHSIQTADALGWALHRAGRQHRALELSRAATRLGTPDARLWIHRGVIEAAAGMPHAATRHLRYGLRVDAGVSPWLAERARAALRGGDGR